MIKNVIKKAYSLFLCKVFALNKENVWLLLAAYISDYKQRKVSIRKIIGIHKKGFSVTDWYSMGVTNKNYKTFLSSAAYISLHPLNGGFSHWIDDKLTLKYILDGNGNNHYMPAYYAQIDSYGNIRPLMDFPFHTMGGIALIVSRL